MEIKTADDLRQAYPALVDQIEQAAADRATNEERERIRDIEEMALPGSEEITAEAKFTKPVSASDYAKAAMKRAKEQGGLDGLLAKAISGINAMPPKGTCADCSDDELKAAIKHMSGL